VPNVPQITIHSSSSTSTIIQGWYNRPVMATVIVDFQFTPKGKKGINS
jgi:hypothetical protein